MFNFNFKFADKLGSIFKSSGNQKKTQKTGSDSLAAQSDTGSIVQIHNHFEIRDIQSLAIGGEGVLGLLDGARGRFALEQAVKQDNFKKAVQEAELDTLESHKPLDKDWFMRWMEVSQSVSREDIRSILSAILKGEVGAVKNTSAKTLEVLRNLSTIDLELFQKFCNISFNCPTADDLTLVIAEPYGDPAQNAMQEIGFNYPKLTELQDLGLIKVDLTANHPAIAQVVQRKIPFTIGPNAFQQTEDVELRDDFKPRVIFFTKVGLEIRDCLELTRNDSYVKKFEEWINNSFPKVKKETEVEKDVLRDNNGTDSYTDQIGSVVPAGPRS